MLSVRGFSEVHPSALEVLVPLNHTEILKMLISVKIAQPHNAQEGESEST